MYINLDAESARIKQQLGAVKKNASPVETGDESMRRMRNA